MPSYQTSPSLPTDELSALDTVVAAAEELGWVIPLFIVPYTVQTDFGVLTLAFATPHVDAAREFALLFESIASSCAIQPTPPNPTLVKG